MEKITKIKGLQPNLKEIPSGLAMFSLGATKILVIGNPLDIASIVKSTRDVTIKGKEDESLLKMDYHDNALIEEINLKTEDAIAEYQVLSRTITVAESKVDVKVVHIKWAAGHSLDIKTIPATEEELPSASSSLLAAAEFDEVTEADLAKIFVSKASYERFIGTNANTVSNKLKKTSKSGMGLLGAGIIAAAVTMHKNGEDKAEEQAGSNDVSSAPSDASMPLITNPNNLGLLGNSRFF